MGGTVATHVTIHDVSDEMRQCVICGQDAEAGRWMLCDTCRAQIEQNNQNWNGAL